MSGSASAIFYHYKTKCFGSNPLRTCSFRKSRSPWNSAPGVRTHPCRVRWCFPAGHFYPPRHPNSRYRVLWRSWSRLHCHPGPGRAYDPRRPPQWTDRGRVLDLLPNPSCSVRSLMTFTGGVRVDTRVSGTTHPRDTSTDIIQTLWCPVTSRLFRGTLE